MKHHTILHTLHAVLKKTKKDAFASLAHSALHDMLSLVGCRSGNLRFYLPPEVFMKLQTRFKNMRQQRGQGMTEYIIIVALIAIASIAVYQFFGNTVRNQTAAIAQELSGGNGDAAKNAAQEAAKTAADDANTKRTLDNYTGNAAKGGAQ
jgi:type IV pilus assembly protein PilA